MHTVGKIPAGTTGKAGYRPDRTEYPVRDGSGGKDYGTERCCNSFLSTPISTIAPQSVTGEDHDGTSRNLITRENYEYLRASYFRYAELLDKVAPHDPGKSIGEGIANLYREMDTLIGENVFVNYEQDDGRLYFNLWSYHTWGEYTLYYFPVKFVEELNPVLKRLAVSFIHELMHGNGLATINDEDDTEWAFDMLSQDPEDEPDEEGKRLDRLLAAYRDGRIYRLLNRVQVKSYYKNLPKAIERYRPRNGMEQELVELMKRGLDFLNPERPIMSYAYDPYFDEEPDYYPMGLDRQIRVVYDCKDMVTECLVDFYNSSRQETYDIVPITTLALSPETDRTFSMKDDYPERFFRWADEFINFIY